jgi:hypothetical protein
MGIYDIGDVVYCRGTFKDANGDLQDPSTVVAKIKSPSGGITTYTYGVDINLVRISQGIYSVSVSIGISGLWAYRFQSTGTGQTAGEQQFKVRRSFFG